MRPTLRPLALGRVGLLMLGGLAAIVVAATAVASVNRLSGRATTTVDPLNDDPALAPIPTIQHSTMAQSIVVRVLFNGPSDVQFMEGSISDAPPPAHAGGPPLIQLREMDAGGELIDQFDEWNPRWWDVHEDEETHHVAVQDVAEGRFVFKFDPQVATLGISDVQAGLELTTLNIQPIIAAYCEGAAGDPGCEGVSCPGDVNGDGAVTLRDVWVVARAIASARGDRRWNLSADLDNDGVITARDLIIVVRSLIDRECRMHAASR